MRQCTSMHDLRPIHLSLCQEWPLAAMLLLQKKEQPLKRNTIKTGHFFEVIDVKEHYIKSCIIHILTRDPEINSTLFHLTRCWYIFELGLCQGITFSLLFFSSISMPSSVVYNAQAFHFSSNFIGCP